jgi:hypothetical protein
MNDLIQAINRFGAPELASEEAACNAIVAARFPYGITCPRCGSSCIRTLAKVQCTRRKDPHHFTILVGTPFEKKRGICIRALFVAIRAFSKTHRSISARELANELHINHVTLWRHLHTLRAMMPMPDASPINGAAVIPLSDDYGVRAGATCALRRVLLYKIEGGHYCERVGHSVRTWINGTFHGVSFKWLSLYLREISARWTYREDNIVTLLNQLIRGGSRMSFNDARHVAQTT